MLTVIGDLVEDVVVWTDGPTRRGTDNPATVTRSRGGSAANVAARAAAFAPTRFIGRVGDDAVGAWLADALAETGVDVRVQRGGRTGSVVVVVDPTDGERTMFPDRAAATQLEPVDPGWLAGTSVLHVPAYGFASDPTATSILGAIDFVRHRGGRVSIDVSAVTVVESLGRERFVALLDRVDPEIVLANAEEAAVLGLAERRPRSGSTTVIKDGPRPALVLTDEGECHQIEAEHVADVRDTTGAGDAFAAGFLAAWMIGADAPSACRTAHRTAAKVLGTPGAG